MKRLFRNMAVFAAFAVAPLRADYLIFANTSGSPASLVLNPGPNAVYAPAAITGSYLSNGGATGTFTAPALDPQYPAGFFSAAGVGVRDYFIFDLSGLSAFPINAAQLVLTNPSNGFVGTQPLNFTLYPLDHPTFDISALAFGEGGTDAYADLGDGSAYGAALGLNAGVSTVSVNLDQQAIDLIASQLGSGFFPLGGAVTATATPEPGYTALLAAGLAAFIAYRKKGAAREN